LLRSLFYVYFYFYLLFLYSHYILVKWRTEECCSSPSGFEWLASQLAHKSVQNKCYVSGSFSSMCYSYSYSCMDCLIASLLLLLAFVMTLPLLSHAQTYSVRNKRRTHARGQRCTRGAELLTRARVPDDIKGCIGRAQICRVRDARARRCVLRCVQGCALCVGACAIEVGLHEFWKVSVGASNG
jgi:hypothetical protein